MEEAIIDLESTLRVLDSCISRANWRLRPAAKRRLETDIFALSTGLRPVVMVDYGGKIPELQEHVCTLLQLARKDQPNLRPLRVMVIEEMIYIIHVHKLSEYALSSINLQPQLFLVDLQPETPEMMLHTGQFVASSELLKIQKLFTVIFSENAVNGGTQPDVSSSSKTLTSESSETISSDLGHVDKHPTSQTLEYFDLSTPLKDMQITLPTLNGWLLGYPTVYWFTKDHFTDAVYNLSTRSLNIFRILVSRKSISGRRPDEEELMSFTMPYDLSIRGSKEPWAEAFLANLQTKFESCRQIWTSLRLEVTECHPHTIAL